MLKMQKRMLLVIIAILVVIAFSTMWIFISIKLPSVDPQKDSATTSNTHPLSTLVPAPTQEIILTPTPILTAAPVESLAPTPNLAEIATDEENAAFGKTVKDIPYKYDSMVDKAVIRLDSDPQLEGVSISTFVALRDETYTVFFKQNVDRNSVKEALTRKYLDQSNIKYPKLLLQWTSDRQLHIKVLATQIKDWDHYMDGYRLDLSGIKNVKGDPLGENEIIASFFAIVERSQPNQLWRYSIDGQSKEQLTDFIDPFAIMPLDENNEHLLLTRFSHYCACDAQYPVYSSVYNTHTKQRITYPIEIPLMINYQGEGSFVADSRGFFYKFPPPNFKVPHSNTTHILDYKEYIYGANFSKNHDYLLMAIGEKEQTENFDLVILSLKTNKEQRYSNVIKGYTSQDQVNGQILSFTFRDDGKRVYFSATDGEGYQGPNYYYVWESKKIVAWSPPEEVRGWTGFTESSDGVFRLYANGGLFKNGHHQTTTFMIENYYGGIWIPDTHLYVVPRHSDNYKEIDLLNADTLVIKPFIDNLPSEPYLHYISSDGKWLTLNLIGSKE